MEEKRRKKKYEKVFYSFILNFTISILLTIITFFFICCKKMPPKESYMIITLLILLQIYVQIINLMHIKSSDYWKIVSLVFTLVVASIIVLGTLWIMSNLYKKMLIIL